MDAKLKARLRSDTEVTLMGLGPSPLTLNSSILNRFLASRLLFNFGVNYLCGRFEGAESMEGEGGRRVYRVRFTSEGQTRHREFDAVVLRHGPLSALARYFKPVWEYASAKLEGVREVDRTRHPIWPRGEFFGPEGRSTAQRSLEARVTHSSAEPASAIVS